jgi:hypothetical protein
LKAGCELFLRYTTRTSALELEDFTAAKRRLIERGNQFADTSIRARATIAELGARFIRPGCVLLTHGMSRVVLALLQRAVASVSGQPIALHLRVDVCRKLPRVRRMSHAVALFLSGLGSAACYAVPSCCSLAC